MMKSAPAWAATGSEVAIIVLFRSSKKACMSGSSIGLRRWLIWSTRPGSISRRVTSWCCENRRALERPTYPAPATVIFNSFPVLINQAFI